MIAIARDHAKSEFAEFRGFYLNNHVAVVGSSTRSKFGHAADQKFGCCL